MTFTFHTSIVLHLKEKFVPNENVICIIYLDVVLNLYDFLRLKRNV